jgi:predicted DNA-binding transcriptional regulator YafY
VYVDGMPTTPTQVSPHLVRVVRFLRTASEWMTARDIAAGSHVSPRTARLHAATLADLGLANVEEVFGGYRYRWSGRQHEMLQRIERASAAMHFDAEVRGPASRLQAPDVMCAAENAEPSAVTDRLSDQWADEVLPPEQKSGRRDDYRTHRGAAEATRMAARLCKL